MFNQYNYYIKTAVISLSATVAGFSLNVNAAPAQNTTKITLSSLKSKLPPKKTASAGTIAILTGTNLTAGIACTQTVTTPVTKLCDTSIKIRVVRNGQNTDIDAPLFSVSPSAIELQVPYEQTKGNRLLILNTALSTATPRLISKNFSFVETNPYIITTNTKAPRPLDNGSSSVTPANPFKAGSDVVFTGVGFGQSEPGAVNGQPSGTGLALKNVKAYLSGAQYTNRGTISSKKIEIPLKAEKKPGQYGIDNFTVTIPTNVAGSSQSTGKAYSYTLRLYIGSKAVSNNRLYLTPGSIPALVNPNPNSNN